MRNKKKKTPSKVKYGDNPRHFHFHNQWKVDQDYWDKLTDSEKDFLKRFNSEWVEGTFKEGKQLHKTKTLKKECYTNNNRAKRDVLNNNGSKLERLNGTERNRSRLEASNKSTSYDFEDVLIRAIDKKIKL